LFEASGVEMFAQGMEWELLYVLQMRKLRTFEELATKADGMETMIENRCDKSSYSYEFKKDKGETNRALRLPRHQQSRPRSLPFRNLYEFQGNLDRKKERIILKRSA